MFIQVVYIYSMSFVVSMTRLQSTPAVGVHKLFDTPHRVCVCAKQFFTRLLIIWIFQPLKHPLFAIVCFVLLHTLLSFFFISDEFEGSFAPDQDKENKRRPSSSSNRRLSSHKSSSHKSRSRNSRPKMTTTRSSASKGKKAPTNGKTDHEKKLEAEIAKMKKQMEALQKAQNPTSSNNNSTVVGSNQGSSNNNSEVIAVDSQVDAPQNPVLAQMNVDTLARASKKAKKNDKTATLIRQHIKDGGIWRKIKICAGKKGQNLLAEAVLDSLNYGQDFDNSMVKGRQRREQWKLLYGPLCVTSLNQHKGHVQGRLKKVMFSYMAKHQDKMPELKDILRIANRTLDQNNPDDMALFQWYWLDILPKAAGNGGDWKPAHSHYATISDGSPPNSKVPYITASTEAFAVVAIEGNYERWELMCHHTKEHPNKKQVHLVKPPKELTKGTDQGVRVLCLCSFLCIAPNFRFTHHLFFPLLLKLLPSFHYFGSQLHVGEGKNQDQDDPETIYFWGQVYHNKYTIPNAGQKSFTAFTKQGRDRMQELTKSIREARKTQKSIDLEDACLKNIRTLHGRTEASAEEERKAKRRKTNTADVAEEEDDEDAAAYFDDEYD